MTRHARSLAAPSAALLAGGIGLLIAGVAAMPAGASVPPESHVAAGTLVPVEADGYPVTIETAFGDVTLTEEPERVVTVGWSDQDYVLAFGVQPVAVTYWNGDEADGTQIWTDGIVTEEPTVMNAPDGVDLEAVAAADPDVIIALFAGVDEATFVKLSAIAPTVVRSGADTDFGVSWQDTTMRVGEVLGRPARAAELVAGLEDRFEAVAGAHPDWADVEFSLLDFSGTEIGVYGAADPRSRFYAELGFVTSPESDELAGADHWATISIEQAGLVDDDLVIWRAWSEENVAEIEANPVIAGMSSMVDGRVLYVGTLNDVGYAQGWGTILSLPFALDGVVPMLEALPLG